MEDYEIMVPYQSLQALGCMVHSVCLNKSGSDKCPTVIHDFEGDQTYSEKPGHEFSLSADFNAANASDYDALVVPSGRILAATGVLKGRKCTAYPAVKLSVELAGASWLEPDPIHRCFTDENLVTGAAWPGHPEFVAQLMALLGIQVSF